jgi:hypothetical protein
LARNRKDSVLRIKPDLVQTAITVVDKEGHFVSGLSADSTLLLANRARSVSLSRLLPAVPEKTTGQS